MKLYSISFLPLLILAVLVNVLSQATHETGHRLAYQVMGRNPEWAFTKLVQVWETPPLEGGEWTETTGVDGEPGWLKISSQLESNPERAFMAAAGPLAGLLGAAAGLMLARRSRKTVWKQAGLAFSLSASLVAVLYYLRSPIRTGGDEYEIAAALGLAKAAIEIPLAIGFGACLVLVLRELPPWRPRLYWLGTVLLGSVLSGVAMAAADPFVIAQVSAGTPWYRPVIGVSLPVFLVNILALAGLLAWCRRREPRTTGE